MYINIDKKGDILYHRGFEPIRLRLLQRICYVSERRNRE